MLVRDYLKGKDNERITFTIMKAVKDETTPFYHDEFYQTPIRTGHEWKEGNLLDYIVIKKSSCPIDITGNWDNWYKRGDLNCCIITSEETLRTQYSEKQANDMIEYYNRIVK